MKSTLVMLILALTTALTGCVNTSWFAAEYEQQYYLAEDVNVYPSYSFTGIYSVWFSGPEKVKTISSAKTAVAGAAILKKGCPVKILKLFTVDGIDASSSEAKLRVIDRETNTAHIVYLRWPDSKVLLTTELP